MTSPEGDVFRNALSGFAFEAACGGAIRHLADSGCTAKQIAERLDFPVSGTQIRTALYKHLCDTCVLLEQSPEEGMPEAKPEYVLEYDSYGKPSYRRKSSVKEPGSLTGSGTEGAVWKETIFGSEDVPAGLSSQGKRSGVDGSPGRGAALSAYLTKRCSRKGTCAYLSCDFGIPDSPEAKGIRLLNGRQQEYLEGILWPRRRIYHRLDHRIKEILCSLYGQGYYEGICFFPEAREKLLIL